MDHTTLKKRSFYPLGDELFRHPRNTRAVGTGEFRAPKKGEWYLSGALVTAYRAPNDFTSPYMIAKLVQVKTTIVQEELS